MTDGTKLNIGDKVYLARIVYNTGLYEVCELKIRTVTSTYFVGCDKLDKQAHLLPKSYIGTKVFLNRNDALKVVKEAEKHKRKFKEED